MNGGDEVFAAGWEDAALLRRYARRGDGAAFAEVVRRHVDLVYSAALRQVNGDAHLARDVTQMVFADLARKASAVAGERVPAGWLYLSARYAAAKLVRGERRRRRREMEAHMRDEMNHDPAAQLEWERVRPVLDEAMGELKEAERAAILLRFFEGRGFAEVGARLRLSENAARMRVGRALDRLHGLLARRGVKSTSGALALVLAQQAVVAAPAGLAASVSGVVLAGVGTAASVATFMGFTKLQLGLASALVVTGAGGFVTQWQAVEGWRSELAALQVSVNRAKALRVENRDLTRAAGEAQRGRGDAAAEARLREEVVALSRQLDERTRAAEMARRVAAEMAARERVATALRRAASHSTRDMMPQLSTSQPPIYPSALRDAGVEGKVLVEFVVGADGEVHEVIATEATHPEFGAAAVEAIKTSKFVPGVKGQRVVNTRMHQEIVFRLGGIDHLRVAGANKSDAFWPQ